MGSCTGKFDIPQNARYYNGDLGGAVSISAQKYKSVSSKKYAGTNTYQDITHQNAPIGGDIYNHFNSFKARGARTSVSSQVPNHDEFRVQYGLNPYEMKQDGYSRSRTDNLPYKRQQNPNAQPIQNNNRLPANFSRNNRNEMRQSSDNQESEIDYSRLFAQPVQENQPAIKMTQSRYL